MVEVDNVLTWASFRTFNVHIFRIDFLVKEKGTLLVLPYLSVQQGTIAYHAYLQRKSYMWNYPPGIKMCPQDTKK